MLLFICTTCEHMRRSCCRSQNVCGVDGCGGPSVGLAYPMYAGPVKNYWHKFCFVCGGASRYVVDVNGVKLGLCLSHKDFVANYGPSGMRPARPVIEQG
jgi:hypothetical protein